MRIYLSSAHKYPGWRYGVAAHVVHDNLARGLAELGHDVRYHLQGSLYARLPEGVLSVPRSLGDEDIFHVNHTLVNNAPKNLHPWVMSVHSDVRYQGSPRESVTPNCIFVSQTLARLYDSNRFVRNGLDPAEFIYSETKDDYFLFVVAGDIWRARDKGLGIAFRIAELTGIELRVAGGGRHPGDMADFENLCSEHGAVWLGLLHGKRKAEAFAAAKALLFPTQLNEAFGLTVAEALMSGTPVITSDKGAMPEMVIPEVGFVCANGTAYVDAVANIDRIAPSDCRRWALEQFHYLSMAQAYVKEYQREIGH